MQCGDNPYLSESVQGQNALHCRYALDILLYVGLPVHSRCVVVRGGHLCQSLQLLQLLRALQQ